MSPRTPKPVPFYGDRIAKSESLATVPATDTTLRLAETMLEASEETLQNLMLSRFNIASNLRNDIDMLITELAKKLADAKLAEMLLAQKRKRDSASDS